MTSTVNLISPQQIIQTSAGGNRPKPAQPPLDEYYNSLFTALGSQHWWPGKTPSEIIIGAILTQNTSWRNVEAAISNLREAHLLSPAAIRNTPVGELQRLIRPSGYFRQKARKLKAFCEFLNTEYGGSLKRMFATPTIALRPKLLGIWGIGPETADSILLYAGGHEVFVVERLHQAHTRPARLDQRSGESKVRRHPLDFRAAVSR